MNPDFQLTQIAALWSIARNTELNIAAQFELCRRFVENQHEPG
jgi:hypothetical protein